MEGSAHDKSKIPLHLIASHTFLSATWHIDHILSMNFFYYYFEKAADEAVKTEEAVAEEEEGLNYIFTII